MNNNNNNKPYGQWAQRLFERSSPSKSGFQGKVYFGHRFNNNHTTLGQSPFSAFFSDVDKQQPEKSVDTMALHGQSGGQHAFYEDKLESGEPSWADGLTSAAATETRSCHANVTLDTHVTVLNYYDETLDTKTFHLASHYGQVFDYLPGQYLIISVMIAGQEYKRSYSIASTPTRTGNFEITVKRDPHGGVVSNWLHDQLKDGDTLHVKGSYGKFTCANFMHPKLLFLAAGSGIVPIMSMLRWLADTDARVDITLLLSFRTQYDIIFGDELQLIATRHKNVNLFISLTKEPLDYSQWRGLVGRVDKKMLADCVPDLSERAVYLCGPDAFMADCKQYLQALNHPQEHLFVESFTVNSPQPSGQARTQRSVIGRPQRNKTGNYRIRFAKSSKTITTDGELSLLDLAEQSGIVIDNDCRAGNCGECMVKCLKGNIEMTDQAEIADFDRKQGWVYSCCAYPVSDVVLDV
jgi:glycine betaine catabolism B